MKVSYSILFALQALSVAAAPSRKVAPAAESVASSIATVTSAAGSAATSVAAAPPAAAPPAAPVGGAKEEEEKDENEVEQQAQFGAVVNIGGGNVKTDTLFPKGVS